MRQTLAGEGGGIHGLAFLNFLARRLEGSDESQPAAACVEAAMLQS